jgi:hypothetical protein
MDPLSALAIACAVIQFVDFGGKFIYHELFKRDPEHDDEGDIDLPTAEKEIAFLVDGLHTATATSTNSNASATPAQTQLLRICSECDDVAEELTRLIDQVKEQRASNASGQTAQRNAKTSFYSRATSRKTENKGVSDELSRLYERIGPLRRNAIDSVILCLW